MTLVLRKFRPGEEEELWELFFNTVRHVSRRDYTTEQVKAWAPDEWNEERWRSRMQRNNPYVCLFDGRIVGFADLQGSGYIDQFFVHHEWQGRGVGKHLFSAIASEARARELSELSANVSITARPFFESRGFRVIAPQEVKLGTVVLKNFRMRKRLKVPPESVQAMP